MSACAQRKSKEKYFFSPPVAPSGFASNGSKTIGQLPGNETLRKKNFFLFVYFLWWEQVELSGQKVSGREILFVFKGKNIFFSSPPRCPMVLPQVGATPLGATGGEKIFFFFIRLSYTEAQIWLWTLSLCVPREKRKIFFLPQWLPMVLPQVGATPLGNSPVMGGKEKKYFFSLSFSYGGSRWSCRAKRYPDARFSLS